MSLLDGVRLESKIFATEATPLSPTSRVRCVDWLRGLAVLVMIECHALVLLLASHNDDPARHWLNGINGLAAPTFILCAGFSVALVFGRAGIDPGAKRSRVMRSLKRLGVVLIVSLVLKQIFWEPLSHPQRFLWFNVLDCILLSLLAMIPVLLMRRWRGTLLVCLSVLTFTVAPLVASPRDLGWLNPLLNNHLYTDTWPLVPWAGYAFCGGAIGIVFAARPRLRTLLGVWIVLGIVAYAATQLTPIVRSRLADTYDLYPLINAGQRLIRIAIAGVVLLGLEQLIRAYPLIARNPLLWLIDLFGRQSLVAYVTHLLFLFCIHRILLGFPVWRVTDWSGYAVQAIVLMAVTALVCFAFDVWSKRRKSPITNQP